MDRYPYIAPLILSRDATQLMVAPRGDAQVLLLNTTDYPAEPTLRMWPEGPVNLDAPAVAWGGTADTMIGTDEGQAAVWDVGTLPIGYGGVYRLSAGGATLDISVALRPAAPTSFDPSMSARDRKLFRASFRRSPALGRQILGLLGERLVISKKKDGCGEGASCASSTGGSIVMHRAHVNTSEESRFIMQHEFGHIVMFTGLSEEAMTAFEALLKKTKRYRCTPYAPYGYGGPKGCVPLAERFADEYARWSLGIRKKLGGYRTPPLLTRTQMTRFLTEWVAVTPPMNPRMIPGTTDGPIPM